MSGFTEVEVDAAALTEALLHGLVRLAADGVYELTPKGDAWLREWCAEQLAKRAVEE